MSYVPGDKSIDPKIHFEAGIQDFARFDKVRLVNIGGSIQYGILYSIIFLIIGILLHILFPALNKNDTLLNIFNWIILQSIVIIIIVFYVEKFVQAIPGIASFFPQYFNINELITKGFIPYGVSEFKGNMAASLILIGTQIRLLEKISYFTNEFSKRYLL
jgi:hypothetical protein